MTTNARDEKWSEWYPNNGVYPIPKGAEFEVKTDNGEVKYGDLLANIRWRLEDDGHDIIAYRYKIKEPESDMGNAMHPDLQWLADNVSEWGGSEKYPFIGLWRDPNRPVYSAFKGTREVWTRTQWKTARRLRGLDQPEVTPEEEEAWQAKERELIGGPRKAESFLHQAAELLAERGKQYDQPGGERSMGKTMGAFNIITGRDLTEAEGWLIMTLLKRVRQYSGQGYHKDSAEDGVTYGALEAEALESAG